MPNARFAMLAALSSVTTSLAVPAPSAAQAGAEQVLELDGRFGDWGEGDRIEAQGEHLYLRLTLEGTGSLQNGRATRGLYVDLDGDESTGFPGASWKGETLGAGAEVVVLFAPPYQGSVGNGVSVEVYGDDGTRLASGAPSIVDLGSAPTHASGSFEVRVARRFEAGGRTIDHGGSRLAAFGVVELNARGAVERYTERFEDKVDPAVEPPFAGEGVPSKGDALRVVSMNVRWASPMQDPAPFSRVLSALKPDVLLIQEWDVRDRQQPRLPAEAVEGWLEENIEPASEWSIVTSEQRGVAVASRLPLTPTDPVSIKPMVIGDRTSLLERTVRYAAARIESPMGEILTASVHLKCCGGPATEEDRERIAEALAVNTALHEAQSRGRAPIVLLGGDMNLVGSPIALEVIRAGLDADGSSLNAPAPRVLGDTAHYTWIEAGDRFPPAKLDFVLVSDASARVARSFVLDTARLSDAALEAAGLHREDSAATDHRPVVVDLLPRD